jgi:hypothetical protein
MISLSDGDLASPFLCSPSKGFSFQADLSAVDFRGPSPFFDFPMSRADACILADDIAPFADVLSAFESARQEQPSLRPFVSFEATELAVSRLRTPLK